MKVLAHRGDHRTAPENTLAAFRSALRDGFGLETDLRLTDDDSLVLLHDRNLRRVSDVDATVDQLSLDELKTVEVGPSANPHVVPTLPELLEIFVAEATPSAELALHLKAVDNETAALRVVETLERWARRTDRDLLEQIVVFDVTVNIARAIKRANPSIRVGLSIGESDHFPDEEHPTIYPFEAVGELDCWDVAWADEWTGSLYTDGFFRELREKDKTVISVSPELHANTDPRHPKADSPADIWQTLERLGVDGVCTDFPERISERQ
ncbi:hypothetical protein GRX03_05155 [Halovenus sp. WSH3]|uniref:GP-PDE domain-containing protein n=1 Tax=Halovenus carboxidivorans TaxID=2692199 RepID=A0A6B0SZP5_9EURY|nr:glycerophosphodiester phosphodiesterase [Halovenus carboxidivorans]MXR50995.1 hypothetical protein [Halovenus carboxidivorans]